jgi:ribosome maturation factor RimP
MCSELNGQIEELITQFTDVLSAELVVDWNLKKRGKTTVIEIIADKPGGGITIGECALINKSVVRGIEEKQWFGGDFVIEVSSPGLDRALKTRNDFHRAIGREIRVHLLEPVEGKVEYKGKISEVNEGQVLINYNGQIITIPLKHISKAVQIIEGV